MGGGGGPQSRYFGLSEYTSPPPEEEVMSVAWIHIKWKDKQTHQFRDEPQNTSPSKLYANHTFCTHTHKEAKQGHTRAVWLPSERWQSCPVQESWPPSAAVGTMPPVSPSLSPPKSFPHQPAGTGKERRTEGAMYYRTAEVVRAGVIQRGWVNMYRH